MHNDIDTGYLARFTWNQRLLQDRLELAVGRSNARQHFYMANCENVITCNDPVIDNSTGILPYPYGSWGGYTRYRFDSGYYLHSGVFESNPSTTSNVPRGLTGTRVTPAVSPGWPG